MIKNESEGFFSPTGNQHDPIYNFRSPHGCCQKNIEGNISREINKEALAAAVENHHDCQLQKEGSDQLVETLPICYSGGISIASWI